MGLVPAGVLALDPRTPTTMWACTFGQGVIKSTDGGDTWRATKGGPFSANALVVDPRNSSVVYVSSPAFNANEVSVYRSVDGGETFAPLPNAPSPASIGPRGVFFLAIDAQSVLYAVLGNSRVFRSADSGATWEQLTNAPPAFQVFIDPVSTSILYLRGPGGLLRSTNGGGSFTPIYGPSPAFAIDLSAPATLYAGATSGGMVKSTDRGATWHPTGLTIPQVTALASDPTTPGRVYLGTTTDPGDVFVIKVVE